MVSDERALEHCNRMLASSLIASAAYQKTAHMEFITCLKGSPKSYWILLIKSLTLSREQHIPDVPDHYLYLPKGPGQLRSYPRWQNYS